MADCGEWMVTPLREHDDLRPARGPPEVSDQASQDHDELDGRAAMGIPKWLSHVPTSVRFWEQNGSDEARSGCLRCGDCDRT